MKTHISGRHIDIGEALRAHVETRLPDMIGKYFATETPGTLAEATITFAKQGSSFETTSAVHLDSGVYLHASGSDGEIYHSFDQSLIKLEKQLRRYKRRLKNHHKNNPKDKTSLATSAPEKIFSPESSDGEAHEEFSPVIIAESEKMIPHLTMSDAVMQLEVGHSDFLIFRKADSEKLQLLYRRTDKNIGWMELD